MMLSQPLSPSAYLFPSLASSLSFSCPVSLSFSSPPPSGHKNTNLMYLPPLPSIFSPCLLALWTFLLATILFPSLPPISRFLFLSNSQSSHNAVLFLVFILSLWGRGCCYLCHHFPLFCFCFKKRSFPQVHRWLWSAAGSVGCGFACGSPPYLFRETLYNFGSCYPFPPLLCIMRCLELFRNIL